MNPEDTLLQILQRKVNDLKFNLENLQYLFIKKTGTGSGSIDSDKLFNFQTFTANGTWTKPPGLSVDATIKIQGWGGGGGGGGSSGGGGNQGGGGGGGGNFLEFIFRETITVGAAGAGGTAGVSGAAGGDSSFGSFLKAYGGGGGMFGNGGSGVSAAEMRYRLFAVG